MTMAMPRLAPTVLAAILLFVPAVAPFAALTAHKNVIPRTFAPASHLSYPGIASTRCSRSSRGALAPLLRPARHSLCTLRAAAGANFEVGDRVEFLVKTVSFSRKIVANGMTSLGLTGVVKYVAIPGDPEDLTMITVNFEKV
jgi:hypothetical protein